MTLIPTVRCNDIAAAVGFYTGVLDFEHQGSWPESGDPAFAIVTREGHELHLSSHSGDGIAGQAIAVLVDDAEALFSRFVANGLDTSARPDSPVHQAPLIQSWGTREFYVDDPAGNTLRFIQRP